MPNEKEEQTRDSRRVNITLLLAQTLGLQTMLFLPFIGVSAGAVGHVIVYALIYIVIGIPVMYMENVVGQFTGRDCIEVWKARPCLAHFGYVHIIWQKGIVVKFEEAFDTDFNKFIQRFSLSTSIADVLYTLNVGTGLSFACASRTTFRAACYSNTVIVVVITCCVSVLGICGTVMMICPYAYNIFLVICENFVFVLWYGLERFSEDVHFMQGVQPKSSVKACWLVSGFILVYVLVTQLYKIYVDKNHTTGNKYACYFLIINICVTVLVTIVKLVIALYKKNLYEQLSLDSEWGPKSEILRRSRAMFSAQAMTKEYMYRQYHLQAGILKRQQRSNVRVKQPGVRFDVEKK
ncbi:hypothetical protein SFRURICE_007666 [Spodoptera frugiperda]|nr:hypothetical protein SFRURICE_007666 [Spodoptera frugiperda]